MLSFFPENLTLSNEIFSFENDQMFYKMVKIKLFDGVKDNTGVNFLHNFTIK